MHLTTALLTSTTLFATASAGPAAYGICQAGCAAGAVWGATAGLGAPPAILACNAAFGTCSAACAVVALAPTP